MEIKQRAQRGMTFLILTSISHLPGKKHIFNRFLSCSLAKSLLECIEEFRSVQAHMACQWVAVWAEPLINCYR